MKKTLLLKTLLLLCAIIVGSNSVWADSKTSTLTFAAACGGSGIADDGVEWTVTSDGSESTFDTTKGIHYGTSSAQVKYIKLTTSDITKTITSVKVNASVASGVSATVDVTVDGSAFGGSAKSLTSSAADYTFTGSATGEIVVTVTKSSKATKALYVKSVVVTYDDGPAKLANDLAWSAATKDVTYGETPYNLPTLSNTHNLAITYDSSNKSVATIDADGNVTINNVTGSTTISATTEGDDTYAPGMVSYTLTVTRVAVVEDGVFDFDQDEDYGSGLAKSGVKVQTSTWTAGNVTMVMSGRNCWNDYTDRAEVRLYKANGGDAAGSIELSVPAGYAIAQIDFTGASLTKMGAESGYAVAKDGKSSTWTGTANSVLFTATDRTDIVTITVTYGPTATFNIDPACKEGETYYATYSNTSAFIVPGDITVSSVAVDGEGNLVITDYTQGEVVPANYGVLVSAETAGDKTIVLSGKAGTGHADQMLYASSEGLTAAEMATAAPNCEYYRLTMHNGTIIGFWWGAENGASFAIAANKAYLAVPKGATAKAGFAFNENVANGINTLDNLTNSQLDNNAPMYNLAGQRVNKSYKGVVIVNGKKMLNK